MNKYRKMFVGFYTGLIPRKPQNPSIFGTLTASRHLIYGKNLKIKIWNIFSNHIDHFKGVPKKSLNYSPPLLLRLNIAELSTHELIVLYSFQATK